MSDGKAGGFFAGFLAGAAAGGILAYVVAQEDARDVLVGKALEARNVAADAGGDLRDLYARGKTVIDTARTTIDAAVREGHTTADRLRGELSRESESQSQSSDS